MSNAVDIETFLDHLRSALELGVNHPNEVLREKVRALVREIYAEMIKL